MVFKHLLIATDLSEECALVMQPACQLAQSLGSQLSLIHVVEPLAMAFGADVPLDLSMLQEQQGSQAQQRLEEVLADYPQLDAAQCHIRHGQPRQEIHQLAKELACDLIVVGSHGRHGLSLLLGSTATDLLSAAPCDVLAINLKGVELSSKP